MKTHFPISINNFKDIYDVAYLVNFERVAKIQYGDFNVWTTHYGKPVNFDLFFSNNNFPIKRGLFKDTSIIEVFGEI